MSSWKLVSATVLLVACDAGPLAPPSRPPAIGGVGQSHATTLAAPSLVVVAPGQLVGIAREGEQADRAWFEARFTVRDEGVQPAPIGDGAILVVSAADGPMPQSSPDAETLRIAVRSATLGPDGVVRFIGIATLTDARGESEPFEVAGSVQPSAKGGSNPDYIVWDIVGGNVHEMSFPALTLIRVVGGDE